MPVADAGYAYLRGLVDAKVQVRALPIGPGGTFTTDRRWYELGSAFTQALEKPYVNIVCAAAGTMLGDRAPAATFSKAEDLPAELRAVLGPMAGSKSADIDYVPKTVFTGLHTHGAKNVAIVIGVPDSLEIAALAAYDLVLWGTAEDELASRRRNGRLPQSHGLEPEKARWLVELLEEKLSCAFATTATTAPLAATAAPRATISSPSPGSTASSSRSESSESSSPLPSPATGTSIGLHGRTTRSKVARMWRWCMRSLGFSRE